MAIGDVVGTIGCDYVRRHLASLKRFKQIDVVIANGENSAPGNGITPASASHLFTSGVDVITSGNHIFRRREIYEVLDSDTPILRPANFHAQTPGRGVYLLDKGRLVLRVINLIGTVFLDPNGNPFECVDTILREQPEIKINLVDFHAEASGEKKAMGFYLDGRVSALFGTHTHIQTSDEQILPKGTGYITDLGMTGPYYSVLGVKPELAVGRMKTLMPTRFEIAGDPCFMNGCIFTVDESTGKTVDIERIEIRD